MGGKKDQKKLSQWRKRRRHAIDPQARKAGAKRAAGVRSERQRCPGCKKLRRWYFRANAYDPGRVMPARLVPGGPKVCHICQANARNREV